MKYFTVLMESGSFLLFEADTSAEAAEYAEYAAELTHGSAIQSRESTHDELAIYRAQYGRSPERGSTREDEYW